MLTAYDKLLKLIGPNKFPTYQSIIVVRVSRSIETDTDGFVVVVVIDNIVISGNSRSVVGVRAVVCVVATL